MSKGKRIDIEMTERGLVSSRTKAQALVMSGVVLVNERRVEKPSVKVFSDDQIRIKGAEKEIRYVSRAGLKLEEALERFGVNPEGSICLDVGSSTGGFTDCLLQKGAKHVTCLDVGTNQLVWELRSDERITVMEQTNARHVISDDFSSKFDLITIDVSFISLTKILENVVTLLKSDGRIITLIKPQFEVGRDDVGRGGIVKDPELHESSVNKIVEYAELINLEYLDRCDSPITGAEGNKEFLAHFQKSDGQS